MSIVIDNPRTQALAAELAAREGVSPEEAVTRALEAKLGLDPRRAALDRLAALQAKLAAEGRDWPAWEEMKAWAQDDDDAHRP